MSLDPEDRYLLGGAALVGVLATTGLRLIASFIRSLPSYTVWRRRRR